MRRRTWLRGCVPPLWTTGRVISRYLAFLTRTTPPIFPIVKCHRIYGLWELFELPKWRFFPEQLCWVAIMIAIESMIEYYAQFLSIGNLFYWTIILWNIEASFIIKLSTYLSPRCLIPRPTLVYAPCQLINLIRTLTFRTNATCPTHD